MLVFFLFSPTIVRIDNYLSESRFWTIWDGILATRGCYVCHETMYCFSFLRFCAFFKIFHIQLEEKRKNVSFYTVYVCVKVKLTFVSFFSFFCAPFPRCVNKPCIKVEILTGSCEDEEQVEKPVFWFHLLPPLLLSSGRQVPLLTCPMCSRPALVCGSDHLTTQVVQLCVFFGPHL